MVRSTVEVKLCSVPKVYAWAGARRKTVQPPHHRLGTHKFSIACSCRVPSLHSIQNRLHDLAAALHSHKGIQNVAVDARPCTHESCGVVYQIGERETELKIQICIEATLERKHRRSAYITAERPERFAGKRGLQIRKVGSDELMALSVVEKPQPQASIQLQSPADVVAHRRWQVVHGPFLRRHDELQGYVGHGGGPPPPHGEELRLRGVLRRRRSAATPALGTAKSQALALLKLCGGQVPVPGGSQG
mmetsp:Transcript_88816/g.240808  ORF Transcript_88816/g.240808 Transcript_88816/m.240808 type:complete len:247 (+) Transcript_88816:725-1465(+)